MDPAHEAGGSGAKILGDTQGRQWLVKAPNNPQGKRILANEYVAAALGARIGAVMQLGSVCIVGEDVAATMTLPSGAAWAAGEAFGSAFADGTKPYLDTMAPERTRPCRLTLARHNGTAAELMRRVILRLQGSDRSDARLGWRYELVLECVAHRLGARPDPHLDENVVHMLVRGARRDAYLPRDRPVSQPAGDELQAYSYVGAGLLAKAGARLSQRDSLTSATPLKPVVLSSPLSSRARRSLPRRRRSTWSERRPPATWLLRRGSPRR